jgi:hypothetical protein
MSNTIQSLWQHQEPELKSMSTDEVRQRVDQALSQDRRQGLIVLVTAAIPVACFCIFFAAHPTPFNRIGSVVGISAGLSLAFRGFRLLQSQPLLPSAAGIEAYRRILDREQGALTICWQTMLLLQLGIALQFIDDPMPFARRAIATLATIAPVIVVAILTRAKARAYGRRAQDLDHL